MKILRFLCNIAIVIVCVIYTLLLGVGLEYFFSGVAMWLVSFDIPQTFFTIFVGMLLFLSIRRLNTIIIYPIAWSSDYTKWGLRIAFVLIALSIGYGVFVPWQSLDRYYYLYDWQSFLILAWFSLVCLYIAIDLFLLLLVRNVWNSTTPKNNDIRKPKLIGRLKDICMRVVSYINPTVLAYFGGFVILVCLSVLGSTYLRKKEAQRTDKDAKEISRRILGRVYICTSPKAQFYHRDDECWVLHKCSYEVERIPIDSARAYGYRPCGICARWAEDEQK